MINNKRVTNMSMMNKEKDWCQNTKEEMPPLAILLVIKGMVTRLLLIDEILTGGNKKKNQVSRL